MLNNPLCLARTSDKHESGSGEYLHKQDWKYEESPPEEEPLHPVRNIHATEQKEFSKAVSRLSDPSEILQL